MVVRNNRVAHCINAPAFLFRGFKSVQFPQAKKGKSLNVGLRVLLSSLTLDHATHANCFSLLTWIDAATGYG